MLRAFTRACARATASSRAMESSTDAFGTTLSLARSSSSAGADDADADSTTTPAAKEGEGETREGEVRRKMRDGARKMREVTDPHAGTPGEPWGWLYDLTESGETAERWINGANARLSDRAKTQMYAMHTEDPETWNVDALAVKYRIRKQRVGAILALKASEAEHVRENKHLYHECEAAVESAAGTVDVGTGERHIADVPTMPMFRVVNAFEQGRDAKPKRFVEASELARKQERLLVREFFERLEYNTGVRGKGLRRENRRTHAPPRPEGGYALHVTPLGTTTEDPYIAYRDGTRRPLNEDESEHARQKTPKRRRRII